MNQSVKLLIDRATEKAGTRYKLAQSLGVEPTMIYRWQNGRSPCPAGVRVQLAALCGDDPLQELVRATIEAEKGERRDRLAALLGKALRATGAGLSTAAAAWLMAGIAPELLKRLYTMYSKVHSLWHRHNKMIAEGT